MRTRTNPGNPLGGFLTFLIGAMLLTLTSTAFARSTYLTEWEFFYPDSRSDNNAQCALCHLEYDDSGGYNAYGNAIRLQSQSLPLTTRFANVESMDSDGDPGGYTNIEEINASTQPGWTVGDAVPTGVTGDLDPTSTVDDPPVADAGGPYAGTTGVSLSFDGSGSTDDNGISSYDWDFGDGTSGTGVSPSHTYTTGGVYTVTLTVTDTIDQTDSDTASADINNPPVSDPNGPYSGTAGDAVNFDGTGSTDSDGTIVSYAWNFGDGGTGSGPTPTHVYASEGTYTVSLVVTDNDGASDTAQTNATIDSALVPPVADANGPYSGTVDDPVQFDGSGSSDADGTIDSYAWDFGDGSTGTGVNPTHAYSTTGTFSVSLTVTDNDGLTSTDNTTATIGIGDLPPVADANGPYTGTVGVPVAFDGTGSTDPNGNIDTYEWDFGDGNIGTGATPSHTYASAGIYTVTLTVTDTTALSDSDTTTATIDALPQPPVADPGGPYNGTAGEAVSMDGSGSSDPDGTVVEWNWDFGDGSTGTGEMTSHTYAAAGTYTVNLTVVDNDGLSSAPADTTATIVDQTQIPVADPNGPYNGVEGREVTFDGTGSFDPDGGNIVSYAWDFGDGNTGIGATPTNVYATAGSYTVTLTVTDDEGEVSAPATTTAEIAMDEAPTALTDGPYTGTVDVPVIMDGGNSFDPDGTIVSWDWDFGDGASDSGETVSHAYAAEGVYTVSLTVTDDFGNTGSTTTTATITAPALIPPVADAGGPYSGLVNESVAFNGMGSTDPDGTIVSYDWDFGDGTVLMDGGPTPSHTYTVAGTYNVVLTVTDDDGLSDSDSATATISEPSAEGDAFVVFVNAPNSPSTNVGNGLDRIVRVWGDSNIVQEATVTLTVDAPEGVSVQYSPDSITALTEPGRPGTQYFFDVRMDCVARGTYEILWTATITAAANDDPSNDTQQDVTTLTCNN